MAKKKIDFSGVETYERAPEGTHVAKIATVEETTFQSGSDGFKVAFEITKGAGKGARVYENYPLVDTALWKLKTLLEAIKIKCDGRIMLDTDKMVGKLCEIEVAHEEYDGKTRARLVTTRKIGSSKTNDDEEIDEEDDDIDDEIDEEEEEVEEKKPAKKEKKSSKKTSKKQTEPEEDEDDEEEEEKPAKKSKKQAKKTEPKSKKKPEPEPEEDDDDDDWDDDDWDDDEE